MLESSELPAGTVLGAYRIIRCIGTGGMGAVYEAEHRELHKRVALKTPYSEAGFSPEGRARFVQEGKTASRIRHPHVVDITDVGEIDDIAYLVMEYLEGESLAGLIRREAPLRAQLIADILVPVTVALHEAHGHGVVHRDLKPDNIFLTRSVHGNIHPKVLDFGISKVLGDLTSPRLTSTNTILGTPSYVAPEQLEASHATTPKSDQYSLGVVMYEAATGQNPFANYTSLVSMINAVAKGLYRRPLEINPSIDERLARIALRAMAVSPEARYPSMGALAAELLPLASIETQNAWARYLAPNSATSPLPHLVRSAPPAPGRPHLWWAGASALFLLAGAAAWFRPPAPEAGAPVEMRQALVPPSPLGQIGRAEELPAPLEPPAAAPQPDRESMAGAERPSTPASGQAAAAPPSKTVSETVSPPPPRRERTPKRHRVVRDVPRANPPPEQRARVDEEARTPAPPAPPVTPPERRPLRETLKTDNVDPWAQ